jgi:hypothetical protein
MLRGSRTRLLVVLIWTAGAVAIWLLANAALNPGVSDSDVRECVEEEFIPADECEAALERLEADEEPLLGFGSLFLIWLGVSVLLWLATRPRSAGSA